MIFVSTPIRNLKYGLEDVHLVLQRHQIGQGHVGRQGEQGIYIY